MPNGTFSTSLEPASRKRTVKIADRVWYQNGANPFIAMLKGKGKTDTAENQKVEWVNDNKVSFSMNALSYSASDVSITVTRGANNLSAGDIVFAPDTGEQMLVTSVTGDTSFNVTRAFGLTAAAEGTGTPVIQLLSRAFAEGTVSPDGTVIGRTEDYNYSQIFKHAVKFTRNELNSPRYGEEGDKRQDRRKKILELHKRTIERQLLFGERKKSSDSAGNDLYVSGGLVSFIKTNRINIAGVFTIEALNEALSGTADAEASGDKLLLCGSAVMNGISKDAFGKVYAGAVVSKYGADVTEIVTAYGKIAVVYHPVVSQIDPKMAILVDMENVKYTAITDTNIDMGVQENDYDGVKDLILTDATLQVMNEETHAIITVGA